MSGNWIAAYIFFGLFVVASIVNLVCGFNEWEKKRKITKPFCLFFLTIAAVCAAPTHPLIYIGAFLGMVGDIFLIFKSRKSLLAIGCGSFLLGHLCYIAAMLVLMGKAGQLAWPVYGYMILVLVILELIMIPTIYLLTKKSKPFTIIGVFYASILITVALVAIQGMCWGYLKWLSLVFVGGLFFIASDLPLTTTLFRHDMKRKDFWIMLTYLIGEALIVSGLVYTIA